MALCHEASVAGLETPGASIILQLGCNTARQSTHTRSRAKNALQEQQRAKGCKAKFKAGSAKDGKTMSDCEHTLNTDGPHFFADTRRTNADPKTLGISAMRLWLRRQLTNSLTDHSSLASEVEVAVYDDSTFDTTQLLHPLRAAQQPERTRHLAQPCCLLQGL
eukprot:6492376-Amphidinium_carterae.1